MKEVDASDPRDPRVMNGEIWEELCDTLRRAGARVAGPDVPATPLDRAVGYRYLTQFVEAGINFLRGPRRRRLPGVYAHDGHGDALGARFSGLSLHRGDRKRRPRIPDLGRPGHFQSHGHPVEYGSLRPGRYRRGAHAGLHKPGRLRSRTGRRLRGVPGRRGAGFQLGSLRSRGGFRAGSPEFPRLGQRAPREFSDRARGRAGREARHSPPTRSPNASMSCAVGSRKAAPCGKP